jgi:putative salt-induced outer membrane protein YdiY
MLLRGVLLAVIVGAGSIAHAQIVNVQGLIGDDLDEGVSGSVEGAVDWRTGNVDLLLVRGVGVVRYRRGDHFAFGVVRGDHGRSGDPRRTFVSRIFEHLRYRYQVTPRLTGEAFAQHESDQFRRLRVRALLGAGPRLRLVGEPRWSLHAGLAYLLEYEQVSDDGLTGAGDTSLLHRASTYLVARVQLDERLTASETVYVQPRIDRPRDIRLLSEAALTTAIGARVSFKTALVITHDSEPPPETARTDTSLQSSVAVKF